MEKKDKKRSLHWTERWSSTTKLQTSYLDAKLSEVLKEIEWPLVLSFTQKGFFNSAPPPPPSWEPYFWFYHQDLNTFIC